MERARPDLESALERAVLRTGLRIRRVGDRRRVLDAAGGRVHEVGGVAVRALDLLRAGRPVDDPEVVAGLVAAGIADAPGLPRRDVLGYAAAASLGISTVLLPAAVAAASPANPSVSGSDGELQQFTVTSDSGTVSYLLYRLAHTGLIAAPIERTFVIGTVDRSVQMLLVGAGGSGGVADETFTGSQVLAGGGGGGEVVEVDLGTVPAGTELAVSVAGSPAATSGAATYVRIGGQQLVEAKGGGQGAGLDFGAAQGGSGGGGSSVNTIAGTTGAGSSTTVADVTPSITSSDRSVGGAGGANAGGGGGGAGGAGVVGSSGNGGAGGGGTDISAFFLDYVVSAGSDPGDFTAVVGGGGGGAGLGFGAGGSASGGGGGGGYMDTPAFQGGDGSVGTGGGGGGGASGTDDFASPTFGVPGQGGTGVAWVRIRTS